MTALAAARIDRNAVAAQFTQQVDAAISRDPEAAEYVRRLGEQLQAQGVSLQQEEQQDEPPSSEAIIKDLEDFLRNLREPDDRQNS